MDILQKAKDTLPEITVSDWTPTNNISALAADVENQDREAARAAEAAECLRQVEFYFSEENLPHDKHLLGLFQEGEGTVSLTDVCSFRAMRKFKPHAFVRDVLKRSEIVEVCGKGQRLRRKMPLRTPLTVVPELNRAKPNANAPSADKPWLTKGLMKPTGFEEGADQNTERDIEQDNKDYDPEIVFHQRIETAVARFRARRTMRQEFHKVFDSFLIFGGMRGGQSQFIGGTNSKVEDNMTKKELAEMTARYAVADQVVDGLYDNKKPWYVDFEKVAKGFFSSKFTTDFAWYEQTEVKLATNVVRNFYNYLLHHKVCPEYEEGIKAAIKVCDTAEAEFPNLVQVDRRLPGGYNVAASMLFSGHHSSDMARGDWAQGLEGGNYTRQEAWLVFKTHIYAHGTQIQMDAVHVLENGKNYFRRPEDCDTRVGLEVVSIEMPDAAAQAIYDLAPLKDSIIEPMGKLHCKEWRIPHAAPADLPSNVRDPRTNPDPARKYAFLLEVDTLKHCYPGCKFEATIRHAFPDLEWIDYHEASYASFFTWLPNEKYREWKTPGPPTAWMVKQNEKRAAEGTKVVEYEGEAGVGDKEADLDEGADFDDEGPDFDDEEPD